MTTTARTSWVTWAVLATVLALQCGLVFSQVGRKTTEPHDVPVAVQGPAIVAQTIVERLNRLPGDPLQAVVLPDTSDPGTPVRNGDVVASLVVDVRTEKNVLDVSSVSDPDMNRLLQSLATRVSRPMDRTFETEEVAPLKRPGVARSTVFLLSGLWIVVGFLTSIAWTLVSRRRPKAVGTGRTVVLLTVVCRCLSLLLAALGASADTGSFGALWALGLAAMYAAAITTAALEALFGLVGVAVASTLFVFFTAPLFSVRDPRLLPSPWWQVDPWTPHGVALELATSLAWFGSPEVLRPALVLGGVIVVSLVALASTSHLRRQPRGEGARARTGLAGVFGCWHSSSRPLLWRWSPPSCCHRMTQGSSRRRA